LHRDIKVTIAYFLSTGYYKMKKKQKRCLGGGRRKVILLISWKESATAPYVCWGTKITLAGKRWPAIRTLADATVALTHTQTHIE